MPSRLQLVPSRYWLVWLRLAALLAVAASCALLLHYLAPAERGFCGADSSCEAARKSPLAALGFVGSLPALGVAGYLAVFWITFVPSWYRWLMPTALLGAGVGVALFLYQALILNAFCWLCVAVDTMAVVVAVLAVLLQRADDPVWARQWDGMQGWAWFALLALSMNAPAVWPKVRASDPLPAAIQELQSPNVLTVVEFVDFQCPHCRRLHPLVSRELALLDQPSRVLRFHIPLPFHNLADGAARAALCAAEFDRGDAMADQLFAGRIDSEAYFAYAAALGIPEAAFRHCLDADSTREALAKQRAVFDGLRLPLLPLTFIGGETLQGFAGPDIVAQAFRQATRPQFKRLTPYAFGATVLLIGVGIAVLGRRRRSHGVASGE